MLPDYARRADVEVVKRFNMYLISLLSALRNLLSLNNQVKTLSSTTSEGKELLELSIPRIFLLIGSVSIKIGRQCHDVEDLLSYLLEYSP